MFSRWFFANKTTNITSTALTLCDLRHNDLIFHKTFKADTPSMITIMGLYQICLLKVWLVVSFKHIPDSRFTQITAYICMQLTSKSSSLISCFTQVNSQPISLCFEVLKVHKIQCKNTLKRPVTPSRAANTLCFTWQYLSIKLKSNKFTRTI